MKDVQKMLQPVGAGLSTIKARRKYHLSLR